jgi:carboxymethylenebutenolidase
MSLHVADPGGPPRACVIILHEIFGVNAAMQAEAERWKTAGYLTLVPDLFHRLEPGISLNYTPEEREKAVALWQALDTDGAIADILATVDYVRHSPRCNGRVALMGFCLGGKLAVLAANAVRLDAVVSFYPVQLQHHVDAVRAIVCPTQVHLGDADTHVPADTLQLLKTEFGAKPLAEFELYPGAGHAFYNEFRLFGYAPDAARQAQEKTADFLRRQLGS